MTKTKLMLLSVTLLLPAIASAEDKVHVKEHTTKDGTYVEAHDRTEPNKSKDDNWSTKGNTNPETGKKGTK